jgi:hypothetical protein
MATKSLLRPFHSVIVMVIGDVKGPFKLVANKHIVVGGKTFLQHVHQVMGFDMRQKLTYDNRTAPIIMHGCLLGCCASGHGYIFVRIQEGK